MTTIWCTCCTHVGLDSRTAAKVSRYNQESMKLARTFFILFLAYTVCWTPFAFLTTIDFAGHMPDAVYIFFVLFAHSNSTINVFLYGLTNSHFREGYVRFLRLDRCPCSRFKSMPADTDILLRVRANYSSPKYLTINNGANSCEQQSTSKNTDAWQLFLTTMYDCTKNLNITYT